MAKEYFKNFPKIQYPHRNAVDGIIQYKDLEVTDLSIRFKIIDKILKNTNTYYEYYWNDSDRVDIVADKYYGDANLSWIVMLSSNIFDWLFDLPMPENVFNDYLITKYGITNVYELHQKIHHYEDISGIIIDFETYKRLNDYNKKAVSIYQYEFDLNESKRIIKLLSKEHVFKVLNEFDFRLQQIKNTRTLLKTEDD